MNRLYLVEGLPCSGKSTTSAFLAELLGQGQRVCFVDEGTGDHPADYEFHALAPAGMVGEEEQIVALAQFSGEMQEQLFPYKIYDCLPWEREKPLMLEKWRQFVRNAKANTTYIFNCVFLQNPMCETMMRFGFPEETSRDYIAAIAGIIAPMNPMVLYLKNEDIADSVRKAAQERPGWLDAVIAYHVNGGFGRSIAASGFDGYIRCLKERQQRELRILSGLPVETLILENPQRNWPASREILRQALQK